MLILVYNGEKNKNKSSSVVNSVMGLANEELILFDLEKFKHMYFKEVHTYTESQFKLFLDNIFGS